MPRWCSWYNWFAMTVIPLSSETWDSFRLTWSVAALTMSAYVLRCRGQVRHGRADSDIAAALTCLLFAWPCEATASFPLLSSAAKCLLAITSNSFLGFGCLNTFRRQTGLGESIPRLQGHILTEALVRIPLSLKCGQALRGDFCPLPKTFRSQTLP